MLKACSLRFAAVFGLFSLAGPLAACGGNATSYDVCIATCQAAVRCLEASQSAYQECVQDCDASQATLALDDQQENMSCLNAPQRRQDAVDCESVACSEIPACAATIPACIPPQVQV